MPLAVISAPAGFFQIGQVNNATISDLDTTITAAGGAADSSAASAVSAAASATLAASSATAALLAASGVQSPLSVVSTIPQTVAGPVAFNGTMQLTGPSNTLVWSDPEPAPRLFNFHNVYTGSSSNTQQCAFNRLAITESVNYTGGNYATAFELDHSYSGITGGRTALNVSLLQTAANADSGADNFYTGITATAFARFSQPGSSATNPKGRIFGLNAHGAVQTGFTATNLVQVASAEFDVSISPGSSSSIRSGVSIVNLGALTDPTGFNADNALWFYGSGARWRYGINFSDTQEWPIDDTVGVMFGANYGGGRNLPPDMSCKWGFDLQQVAFPATGNPYDGGLLQSNGITIDGAGTVRLGSTYLTSSSAGLSVDAKGSVGTAATIATAGSGYETGNIVVKALGGLWSIAVVSGVPTGTVTQLVAPAISSTTPPSNPVTPVDLNNASLGSGLTLNLTWNTTATALKLQPTGGAIVLPVSALVNATNDSGASSGGVAVGGVYRNGSALMVRVT